MSANTITCSCISCPARLVLHLSSVIVKREDADTREVQALLEREGWTLPGPKCAMCSGRIA